MSNINIKRAVENIRANTTVYGAIAEAIVNAIQAIEATGRDDGSVTIRVFRAPQQELDGGLSEVESIEIEDNGIGFDNKHRDSFDTLYTDEKIEEGGKGFGRFICLKYFEDFHVRSTFSDQGNLIDRTFAMGKENDIIVDESISQSKATETRTVVRLEQLKKEGSVKKKLKSIARILVEKLLPYFIAGNYKCPEITITEEDKTDPIRLNDFIGNELSQFIKEIPVENSEIELKGTDGRETFAVRIFKFFSPSQRTSKICLVGHKREVAGSAIHSYIPEFAKEFYEKADTGEVDYDRNFIIRAYVFSEYLDRHVSLERAGFDFKAENDLFYGISQTEIESESAEIARAAVGTEVATRQEKKRERVQTYVDEQAPWHKETLKEIDLSELPFNPTEEQIEHRLQSAKFEQEKRIKKEVSEILAGGDLETVKEDVVEVVNRISGTSKNDLIHYIALRRHLLDLFEKSLQRNDSGKYQSEGVVHDIIFPRKGNTDTTPLERHNLWILDERLNFTSWVSSDEPLNGKNSERPDLLAYNKRVLFRGDNEASNPVTIFEFKKPKRDDFANPSSKEDPIEQIVRYVNHIKQGKYETPKGRKILVADNTPFYGYVVCDLSQKVETWLFNEKDFKPMPDKLGYFRWFGNINLYVEVISWDKVFKDAEMRNRIFFETLGL